jgi:4-hydroxy-3-methylbut-2-enyl diphosphate reductase
MRIEVAAHAGHCFGVKAAIQKAFETARQEKTKVFTLGPIIHNPQVVAKLEKAGVGVVNSLSEMDEGVIIIRSHGVAPEVIQEALAKGFKVVDATCPFVKRAQKLAKELTEEGYDLIVLGDPLHPEVAGIVGTVHGKAMVVSSAQQVETLSERQRYGLIAQTTQSLDNLQQVACTLLTKTMTLKVCNTICNATQDLQRETRRLAKQVDLMLVVGGRNSANTTRLFTICQEEGVSARHLETVEEINPAWFHGVNSVGVTAGTSTPDWIINEVIAKLSEFENKTQNAG